MNDLLLRQIDYWLSKANHYSRMSRNGEHEGFVQLADDAFSRAWHIMQDLEKKLAEMQVSL